MKDFSPLSGSLPPLTTTRSFFPRNAECVEGHLGACREVMGRPFTMMYRHCPCGNTLILTFTEEILPALDEFWGMLRREAERAGLPLRQVVGEFSGQCDRYIISRLWSSLGSTEKDPVVEIA
jgi:hypothetical protein